MATLGLQVRHWRGLIWAGTVGLALLSAWNVKQIWEHNRSNEYSPVHRDVFDRLIGNAQGEIDVAEVKQPSWTDYLALAKNCPINGYVPVVVEKPVESGPKENAPPPKRPIKDVLVVTAVADAPNDLGHVVVKYKDDTTKPMKDEVILKVGASLTPPYDVEPFNAALKSIHADVAVFQWCGESVEVRPVRKDDPKGEKTKTTAAATTAKSTSATMSDDEKAILEKYKATDKTATYADNSYVVGKRDYDEIEANPDLYLRDARISERPGPNKSTELVVGALGPKKSLATEYGIQTGDVLVSINGVAMSTKSQAYDYVRNNNDLEKYVVVIKRSGREISKTVLVNRHR